MNQAAEWRKTVAYDPAMERVITQLLAHQDPNARHTWLTRLVVSAIIIFASVVLYGAYGIMAALGVFFIFVGFAGMHFLWAFVPVAIGVLYGLAKAGGALWDYWTNHGHGD